MSFQFDETERATLAQLASSIFPRLVPRTGDSAALFELKSEPDKLLRALEKNLAASSAATQREVKQFLRRLASHLRGRKWKGRLARFSTLSQTEQQEAVRRLLATSSDGVKLFHTGLLKLLHYHALAPSDQSEDQQRLIHEALGYSGFVPKVSETPLPRPALIRSEQQTFAADFLVIGSGAGGSVVAAELAETGKRVILVDAGPLPRASELGCSEELANRLWLESHGAIPTRELPVSLIAGRVFGGGTVINWGTYLEPPRTLLEDWSHQFGFHACLTDSWQHSLYSVRRRLGIAPVQSLTTSNRLLQTAAQRLNWSQHSVERIQGDCSSCQTCSFGCSDGKQDALRTYIADAERLGVHLIPDCRIELLEHDQGRVDRATGVLRDEGGTQRKVEFRFRHLVLSAGAIHTPALLLRSGLGNAHVGQHLQIHPAAIVLGEFEQEVAPWKGPPQAVIVDEFAKSQSATSRFRIEVVPLPPGLLAMSLPWQGPLAYRHTLQKAKHLAGWLVLVHDQNGRLGRVEIDAQGQPRVHYRMSPELRSAVGKGMSAALTGLRAAGASRLLAPSWGSDDFDCQLDDAAFNTYLRAQEKAARCLGNLRLFSAHQMSSCRLASSAGQGAIDLSGRVYGLENVFVCDGSALPSSTGVNPALTITTLSHYLAQQIKRLTALSSP
jgi:choline dehydrogenase-like flavoprotein